METLKSLVLEVESFLANIEHTVTQDVKDDMAIAIKGIVAVRKPPKPKQKPTVKIDEGVDVNTIAERMTIGYSADVEDDEKKDGDVDDFHGE